MKTEKIKIDDIEKIAKHILEANGNHQPQLMFVKSNGKVETYVIPFKDDDDKNFVLSLFKTKVEKENIDYYFHITEGWLSTNTKTRPSNDSDKKECLIISKYSKDMKNEMIIHIFGRGECGKIIWIDKTYSNDNTQFKSRWNFYLENINIEEAVK